jgi:tRNA 2-selenouridine synthase
MGLHRLAADAALQRQREGGFDAVIDARSESEFADDHLPGAQNWPVLGDAERAAIGTMYVQVSAFEARKQGAARVSANIARLIEQQVLDKPRDWRPLVYCWRGGQRSGSLALVLAEIGFSVAVLDGGYRAFRRAVVAELETQPTALNFTVLAGRTGSAKSRLLQALATAGAQVLDLEALAHHRGSVLGLVPGDRQPSQKAFDTALWQALSALDPSRPVFAEGESRTIGRLRLPEPLLVRLRAAPVLQVQMPLAARVEFLLQDYAHFVSDTEAFCERLQALKELRGSDTVARWQAAARAGALAGVVQELLEQHYDPVYTRSMQRHFAGFAAAQTLELPDASAATLAAAAQAVLVGSGAASVA